MMTPASTPFVSVIVPVFNGADRLRRCLEALEQQTYPQSQYEVIVVDNGSDATENIAGVVEPFGQAILAVESQPGSYAARNTGIKLAQGTVLAFTDADCLPAADWLANGVRHLVRVPNCGLVAGRIEVFVRDPAQITPVELFEQITAFPQQKLLDTKHGGATANLFTWKRVMEQVGLFDAQMKSNGDLEWGQRVFRQGYAQCYADDAWVAHPARHSWAELYRRTRRLTGGSYDWQRKAIASPVQKQATQVMQLVQQLVPPLMFVWNAFLDPRLTGLEQKIKVSIAMVFVRYVGAWEMLRLMLGGVSARD
jgi:glycosyltransferase involved in cell wall biosynthesis